MCNLSQGIFEEGREEGRKEGREEGREERERLQKEAERQRHRADQLQQENKLLIEELTQLKKLKALQVHS